jgi:hypothetical protein
MWPALASLLQKQLRLGIGLDLPGGIQLLQQQEEGCQFIRFVINDVDDFRHPALIL